MKSILVTGGAGFIGSHLCERLLKEGNRVVCLDNFDSFYDPRIKMKNVEGISKTFPDLFELATGDIRNPDALADLFTRNRFDAVVHLAARAGVRPSIAEPLLYQDVNIRGTVMLLEACKSQGIKHFVFASSSSVYGENQRVPFSEAGPRHPTYFALRSDQTGRRTPVLLLSLSSQNRYRLSSFLHSLRSETETGDGHPQVHPPD